MLQHKAVNLILTLWKSCNSTEVFKSLELYCVILAEKQYIALLKKEAGINGSMLIDTRWEAAFYSNHRLVFQIVGYYLKWVFLQTLAIAMLIQPICLLECLHWFCSVRAVYTILTNLDGLSSHCGLYSNHLGTYHPVRICFWNSRVALHTGTIQEDMAIPLLWSSFTACLGGLYTLVNFHCLCCSCE